MTMIENLREYQIRKSLTSLELAKILGVELDKLVSWYDGDNSPDADERYRIVKLFDGRNINDTYDDNKATNILND